MRTEYVNDEYVLRLSRDEVLILLSCVLQVDNLISPHGELHMRTGNVVPADYDFRTKIGADREEVLSLAHELGELCDSGPRDPARRWSPLDATGDAGNGADQPGSSEQ